MNYIAKMRNIGIMAHIDAGKTTTTERILFHTGRIHKLGEVHNGEAQLDWMVQEQERGITITSAATSVNWKDIAINIIDTPGHVDFTVEVERSLRVLDGAVAVLDGQAGVEPQTETVWRQATRYNVPRIVFVNKMDKTGADFDYSIASIRNKLKANVAAIHIPMGKETEFHGFYDIIEEKGYIFDHGPMENYKEVEIPADMKELVIEKRSELIDHIIEYDDELFAKVLEGHELTKEEIKSLIRKGVIDATFHPVLSGSAYKNVGVRHLLDAVVDFLPSPIDIPSAKGMDMDGNPLVVLSDEKAPFAALAFKIMTDPFVGKLTFFRVYSGTLQSGSYVQNTTKDKKERVGRLLLMHANSRTEIPSVRAGQIAAAVGLKSTITGDTITAENNPIILEKIEFPEPVISLAVEPKTKGDSDKLSLALQKLAEEDPTFRAFTDQETGDTIIAGMGELHLEIIVDRLKREFKVEANIGNPQVSYRETFTKTSEVESKYIKQSGGRGQYGHVWIKFEPNEVGKGFEFLDKIVGGKIPKEYINSVRAGIEQAMAGGVLAGYPLIDVKATLFDGSYHEVDSSEMAYKIASSMAIKQAGDATKSAAIILEPIMKVEVTTPSEYFGDIMGNLSSRRGQIQGNEERMGAQIIMAHVPLSEMFGYATELRSMSQGRAVYSMEFSHYQQAPRSIADEIIKKRTNKA